MCKRLEFKLDTLYKEKDNIDPNLIDIGIHKLYHEHTDIKSRLDIIIYLYKKFNERLGKRYLNRFLRSLNKDRFTSYYFNLDYKILFTEEIFKEDVCNYFVITNYGEKTLMKDVSIETDYLNKW